jgi:hypothetical protein
VIVVNAKNYELHCYETYWAPKTEGVAKLSDVISFLWDGGVRGLRNSHKPFQRAMLGEMGSFKIPWRSPVYRCITLLVLVALAVINAAIAVQSIWPLGVRDGDARLLVLQITSVCRQSIRNLGHHFPEPMKGHASHIRRATPQ